MAGGGQQRDPRAARAAGDDGGRHAQLAQAARRARRPALRTPRSPVKHTCEAPVLGRSQMRTWLPPTASAWASSSQPGSVLAEAAARGEHPRPPLRRRGRRRSTGPRSPRPPWLPLLAQLHLTTSYYWGNHDGAGTRGAQGDRCRHPHDRGARPVDQAGAGRLPRSGPPGEGRGRRSADVGRRRPRARVRRRRRGHRP